MHTTEATKTLLPNNRGILAALIAIVLLGAALRFTGLDHESLWNDELERYRQANQVDLLHAIKAGWTYEPHPPGYRVFLYFSEKIWGTSEFALRFPGAVAGILAIIAIFLLGRKLYSEREGLIAALFMAVQWCPIYYSQDAGPYPILMLLSIVTVLVWRPLVEQLRQGRNPPRALSLTYILVSIVTCWLHYFGLFFIALQGLATIWIVRSAQQKLKPGARIFAPIFIAFLPWVPFALRSLGRGPIWIPYPGEPISAAADYFAFFFNQSIGLVALVALIALWVMLRRAVRMFRQREHLHINLLSPDQLLVAWAAIPFTIVYLISLRTPILTLRNMIIALPAVYLLSARSITRLTPKPIGQTAISVALAAVFMYNLLYVDNYYTQPHKDQFREAVASIVQRADSYPQAYILGYGYGSEYFDYYFQHFGSPLRVDLSTYDSNQFPIVTAAIKRAQPKYVWLVSGLIIPNDLLLNYFNQNYQLIDQQPFFQAGVWLYQKKTS
ncbi:MAG TPA: glycosyltransferase family 39 protein [Anaerolineae bacterium]|nr:glycosyltransferase family 39 protein [Anaerolineae bacterium]